MGILADVVARYLEERVSRGELDPMTARNHRSALKLFAEVVGKPPERLTTRDLERWLETRTHLRPSTRRSQFSYVATFCAWLDREGLVGRNPAADLRPPRVPRSVPRALPVEAVAATLAKAPDERARAIVWLMVGQGLRCCEVAGLDLEDWDRRRRMILVRGKREEEREIPVSDEVAQALEAYLARHPASYGPLIRSYRSGDRLKPDSISGMVSEWMRAAGVKRRARDGRSAHAFRHTCATDVLDRDPDLRLVQQLLGHRHLSTTANVYIGPAKVARLRAAMAGRSYQA